MKPRPSCYNGAILKKFVVSLKSVKLFRHQPRKKKVFAEWEALLRPGGSGGVWEMGCGVEGMGCGQLTAIGHA